MRLTLRFSQADFTATGSNALPSLAASAPARALGLAGGEGRPIPAFLAVRCTV
ncbi:protein of unknown function [Candidatus Methylacidiphilum fumarolicum]|uniref:Uncharacterized protein n=1 Tax=Candidatus Methylacidiphilum fumarolicum TaxID=591154 RepID=A0ABM9IEV8_9BACT|nr:protein of unknown function [Candidatus Methylacidiphilum fumarolicum]